MEKKEKYCERIRDLREEADLTQSDVAGVLMVCQHTYSDYESGKTRIPVNSLLLLAENYDVSMDYITGAGDERGKFPKPGKKKKTK